MPVKVMIPAALRQFADGKDTVELPSDTATAVLARLGEDFPQLKQHLFSEDGQLRTATIIHSHDDRE